MRHHHIHFLSPCWERSVNFPGTSVVWQVGFTAFFNVNESHAPDAEGKSSRWFQSKCACWNLIQARRKRIASRTLSFLRRAWRASFEKPFSSKGLGVTSSWRLSEASNEIILLFVGQKREVNKVWHLALVIDNKNAVMTRNTSPRILESFPAMEVMKKVTSYLKETLTVESSLVGILEVLDCAN